MSLLDHKQVAPPATNVINPLPGGVHLDRKHSDANSIGKGQGEQVEYVENVLEKGPQDGECADVVAGDHFGTNTVYSPAERSLVRKLDWHIMPIVFCMYFMNKLDQNAIANARLNHLEKDLGLKGNQFNVCVSVLYAGYTLIQVSRLV